MAEKEAMVIMTVGNAGFIPLIARTGPITRGLQVPLGTAEALKKMGYNVRFVQPGPKVPPPAAIERPVSPPVVAPKPVVIREQPPAVPEEAFRLSEDVPPPAAPQEPPTTEAPEEEGVVDLSKMSKAEMLELAEECGVKVPNPKKITEAKLRKLLEDSLPEA